MSGPYCPEGPGGDSTLVNQDEAAILAASLVMPVELTALGMEDDSHVQSSHTDGDVAGY
ncbi:hypothetical protein AB0P05_26575 [Streptomyces flaveolus]|uniref:hypothetical protein n=1 Tax=Streptomyces flaveolus TaxID=67297 RepID=UPI003441EB39